MNKCPLKELYYLESFGRLTALLPMRKAPRMAFPDPNDPLFWAGRSTSPKEKFRFRRSEKSDSDSDPQRPKYHPWLVVTTLTLIISESLWLWDNLKLGYFKRNSQRIHYATFELAIWIGGSLCRLAFLLSAPAFYKFFHEATQYVHEYVVINRHDLAPEDAKGSRHHSFWRFKCMALTALNLIYITQMVEIVVRVFSNQRSGHSFTLYCDRVAIPCKKDYSWLVSIITVIFKVMSSSTLYFLTYFIVSNSHLLMNILKSFKQDVLERLGSEGGDLEDVDLTLVTPIFILKGGSRDETGKKINPLKNSSDGVGAGCGGGKRLREKKDLHKQFSKLRSLFQQFNCAVGQPLIMACLADILVFICICFILLPNLDRTGKPNFPLPGGLGGTGGSGGLGGSGGSGGSGGYVLGHDPFVHMDMFDKIGNPNEQGNQNQYPGQNQIHNQNNADGFGYGDTNPIFGKPGPPPPGYGHVVDQNGVGAGVGGRGGGFQHQPAQPGPGAGPQQPLPFEMDEVERGNSSEQEYPYTYGGMVGNIPNDSSIVGNGSAFFGSGGGGMGGVESMIENIAEKDTEKNPIFHAFFYAFAITYECRAILITFVGTFLKFQVLTLREHLEEEVVARGKNRRRGFGYGHGGHVHLRAFEQGEMDEDFATVQEVVRRMEKWQWQLRPLDMISVDLSMLPAMLGTVMTYVVVLLQIQISEMSSNADCRLH